MGDPPLATCTAIFELENESANTVQLAGEWGWDTPEPLVREGDVALGEGFARRRSLLQIHRGWSVDS